MDRRQDPCSPCSRISCIPLLAWTPETYRCKLNFPDKQELVELIELIELISQTWSERASVLQPSIENGQGVQNLSPFPQLIFLLQSACFFPYLLVSNPPLLPGQVSFFVTMAGDHYEMSKTVSTSVEERGTGNGGINDLETLDDAVKEGFTVNDQRDMQRMGKKQEFRRNFRFLQVFLSPADSTLLIDSPEQLWASHAAW